VDVSISLDTQVNSNQLGCKAYLDISETTDTTGNTVTLKGNTIQQGTMVGIDSSLAPIGASTLDNNWLTTNTYPATDKLDIPYSSSTTTTFTSNVVVSNVNIGDIVVADNKFISLTNVTTTNNVTEVTFAAQTTAPTTMFKPLSFIPYSYSILAHNLTQKPQVAYLPYKKDIVITSATTTNVVGTIANVTSAFINVGDTIMCDNLATLVKTVSATTSGNNVVFDITFSALAKAPTKVEVIDRSILLLPKSKTFNGTSFTVTYDNLTKTGRELVREISSDKKGTIVRTPVTSNLTKLG